VKALVIALLVACGCTGPTLGGASQSVLDGPDAGTGSGSDAGPCTECSCPAALVCDPALGGDDCGTGCCVAALEPDGRVRYDEHGAPIYQCATPACRSDADCGDGGQTCVAGPTCAGNRCQCPTDVDPSVDDDRDVTCCDVRNPSGECCSTGALAGDGTCACADPRMTDAGAGCLCPAGMMPGDDGMCACEDELATYDPATGACACPPNTVADHDPYTGGTSCETEPVACGDPHAHVDPSSGLCVCDAGLIAGDTAGGISAACVPIGCGDGVCSASESCESCDFDCPCGPGGPDAGVPDAGIPGGLDAGVPDAGGLDAGIPHPDAGIPYPDAGIPHPDAGIPHPDAGIPHPDAGIPHPDAGIPHPDAGTMPGSGALPGSGTAAR
jgi:hypothetical protein